MRKHLSIASLSFLLFASVGLSGWTYGENLIPNPNFTDNITGWNEEGATWVNESGNGIANLSGYYLMTSPFGALGEVNTGEHYYGSFLFKTTNESYLMTVNIVDTYPFIINTTTICDWAIGCPDFPSFLVQENTYITPQGDGWYKFETILIPTYGGVYIDVAIDAGVTSGFQVDNVVVMNMIWTPELCQGYECPNLVRDILSYFPVILGLLVLLAMVTLGLTGSMTLVGLIGFAMMALIAVMFISIIAGIV